MTKELEEEGYYREILRRIQDLRKKNDLKREDRINLDIVFEANIDRFKEEIKERAGVKEISFGKKKYKNVIEGKIRDKSFVISMDTTT
mgnify:CR=1 FL=1